MKKQILLLVLLLYSFFVGAQIDPDKPATMKNGIQIPIVKQDTLFKVAVFDDTGVLKGYSANYYTKQQVDSLVKNQEVGYGLSRNENNDQIQLGDSIGIGGITARIIPIPKEEIVSIGDYGVLTTTNPGIGVNNRTQEGFKGITIATGESDTGLGDGSNIVMSLDSINGNSTIILQTDTQLLTMGGPNKKTNFNNTVEALPATQPEELITLGQLVDSLNNIQTDVDSKLDHGGYSGTGQGLLDSIQGWGLQKTTEVNRNTDQGIRVFKDGTPGNYAEVVPSGGINPQFILGRDGLGRYMINVHQQQSDELRFMTPVSSSSSSPKFRIFTGDNSVDTGDPEMVVAEFNGRVQAKPAQDPEDLVPFQQLQDSLATIQTDIGTNYQQLSEKNQPNGYPGLQGDGTIAIEHLPAELVSLQGNWDASTNTPTLADGVGDPGDAYTVSTDGTQDLGSGSIQFFEGDLVIYNGTEWFRNAGGITYQSLTFTNGDLSISNGNTVVLDDRYYTQTETYSNTETDGLLSDKADKSTTINAGNWLAGGGNLSGNRTLSLVPTTNTWVVDSESNQRMYFAGTSSSGNGIIFKASTPGQQFQYRDSDNNLSWVIGDDGELKLGDVPWARLTGVPSLSFTDEVSQLSFDTSTVDISSLANLGFTDGGNPITTTGRGYFQPFNWGGSNTGWEDPAGYGIEVTRRSSATNFGGLQIFQGFSSSEQPLKYRQKLGGDLTTWAPERTIWSDFNLPDPATDADVVHLSGNEIINDVKTFTSPLRSSFLFPDADGTAGSGNTLEHGISIRTTNSLTNVPNNISTLVTFDSDDSRKFQISASATNASGIYWRPFHTLQDNIFARFWDDINLPDPATETWVNSQNYFPTNFNNPINSIPYGGGGEDLQALPTGTYSAGVSSLTTNLPYGNPGGLISFGSGVQTTRILGARDGSDNLWFSSGPSSNIYRRLVSHDYLNGQGFLTSPGTLQEATDAGNTTSNGVSITGNDNLATFPATRIYRSTTSGNSIIENYQAAPTSQISMGIDGIIMGAYQTGGSPTLNLREQIAGGSGQAGADFNVRVEGQSAQKPNEFFTSGNLGYGLSWNQNFFRFDWGETEVVGPNTWHILPLVDDEIVSFGDPVNETTSPYMYVLKGATAGAIEAKSGTFTDPGTGDQYYTNFQLQSTETFSGWRMDAIENPNGLPTTQRSIGAITTDPGIVVLDSRDNIGLVGKQDYSANIDPLAYAQQSFVNAAVNPTTSAWQSIALSGGATASQARVRKKGNVVEIELSEYIQTSGGAAVIPVGYRPTINTILTGINGSTNPTEIAFLVALTTGQIGFVANSPQGVDDELSVTYQFTIM